MKFSRRHTRTIVLIAAMCTAIGCMPGTRDPTGLGLATGNGGGGTGGVSAGRLAFLVQPNNVSAGSAISPEVKVIAVDSLGNVLPGFGGTVSVALGSGPGTLSGTTSVAASGGLAIFGTLAVSQAGQYRLVASAPGLASVTSAPFAVF
jgi:hypothetical protein